jgi:RND family efflux transporter MFP subunit
VPEDRAGQVKPGSPVAIRDWAGGMEFDGKVREIAASADAVTRTFMVKVTIDPETAPALGATVYARPKALSHSGAPVLKVPTSALRQEGQGTAVWVLDKASMTVRSQPVVVATADGNEAVIGSGLMPGMLVVAAGVHVLQPGQKVTIYQDRSAAAAAPVASR